MTQWHDTPLRVLLLLQACRPTLAARRSLAHEWKMFKDLSLLANDFQAARSHFLQVSLVTSMTRTDSYWEWLAGGGGMYLMRLWACVGFF